MCWSSPAAAAENLNAHSRELYGDLRELFGRNVIVRDSVAHDREACVGLNHDGNVGA